MITTHFSNSDNIARFISHSNDCTLKWYHKKNSLYYIFKLETIF